MPGLYVPIYGLNTGACRQLPLYYLVQSNTEVFYAESYEESSNLAQVVRFSKSLQRFLRRYSLTRITDSPILKSPYLSFFLFQKCIAIVHTITDFPKKLRGFLTQQTLLIHGEQ